MLKKAVKLLRGSVCVRAKSAYPERMLNLCSARGIEFWDVRWIDDTALSFCVARGDLRALRRAAEASGRAQGYGVLTGRNNYPGCA